MKSENRSIKTNKKKKKEKNMEQSKKPWRKKPLNFSRYTRHETQEDIDDEDLKALEELDMETDFGQNSSIEMDKIKNESVKYTSLIFEELKNMRYDRIVEYSKNFKKKTFNCGITVKIGIDPGPVNCGFALSSESGYIGLCKHSFRQSGFINNRNNNNPRDKSCESVVERWRALIMCLDGDHVRWVIENQITGIIKGNDNREQEAMVWSLYGMIGKDRCRIIGPSEVESKYYPKWFTRLPREQNESDDDYAKRKRKHKKECAVRLALELLKPCPMMLRVFKEELMKNHDVADAVILLDFDDDLFKLAFSSNTLLY